MSTSFGHQSSLNIPWILVLISDFYSYSSVGSSDSYYTLSENEMGELEVRVETSGSDE